MQKHLYFGRNNHISAESMSVLAEIISFLPKKHSFGDTMIQTASATY